MKLLRRYAWVALLLGAGLLGALASEAGDYGYQQPFLNITAPNQISGLIPAGTIATQGIPFSTNQAGNPLLLQTSQLIGTASINAGGGTTFITGATGRTLYPSGLTVMAVGGNATGATSVVVECTSGNILATFPIAALVSAKPAPAFYFASAIVPGVALGDGCASGDGIFVSTNGSNLATTTGLWISLPYTVQ